MKNFYKYLPVTDTEKKWGFYITSAGYNHINPKEVYPSTSGHPSTHVFTWNKGRILDGYYLVFIGGGEGIFESALTMPHVITAGTCFFLFPDVWHRYKPSLKTGWEEYWIGFNGTYPRDLMSQGFFTPARSRCDETPAPAASAVRTWSGPAGKDPGGHPRKVGPASCGRGAGPVGPVSRHS
jgi:hypothetical protein